MRLLISMLSLCLFGCVSSPTGRSQIILVSDEQMDAMGTQAFTEMKSKIPKSYDAKTINFVNCVVNPLTNVVGGTWEVVVFKDDSANAFALPGGKIGVHTGILKAAKTDAQLAAVIGHEIGHVLAKHGAERVSQSLATQGGLQIIDAFISGRTQNSGSRKLIMAGLGLGLQFGVTLPHGRTQESEADVIGLDIMSDAGFDPRESISLWKNMSSLGGGQTPEWLSTHPSHETRISDLQSKLPSAIPRYQKAKSKGYIPSCIY